MKPYGNIDELDNKILQILTADSRTSYADIGRQLHLSRASVRDRVMNMQDKGIIERFSIIINPRKMGYGISSFLEIECVPNMLTEAAKILSAQPQIQSCNQMTGKSLLHSHAAFKDLEEMDEFLDKHVYSLPGVKTVNSSILLKGFKTKMGGMKIN